MQEINLSFTLRKLIIFDCDVVQTAGKAFMLLGSKDIFLAVLISMRQNKYTTNVRIVVRVKQ